MCAGVAVFGTFSGLVASWFLSASAADGDSDIAEIKMMLKELQARVETDRSGRVVYPSPPFGSAQRPSYTESPVGRVAQR